MKSLFVKVKIFVKYKIALRSLVYIMDKNGNKLHYTTPQRKRK